MDKSVFQKRLAELQGNMKDVEFAKLCGIPNATMGMYKSGSLPSIEKASAIAEKMNVSIDWLCGRDNSGPTKPLSTKRSIPHFDIEAHAGSGTGEMIADISSYISFDEEWFARNVPEAAILGALDVSGDSMAETLNPGDMIIVDMNRDHITNALAEGGIFVFAVRGDLKVKRLQPMLDGGLRVISDNPRYETEVIPPDLLAEDVIIQGHVVWVGGPLR
jgi:phage repressor protein C with HTH and peptisase S24 domain